MESFKNDNPFYRNYTFGDWDRQRRPLSWHHKLRMLFKPMYVMPTIDMIVHYKVDGSGRIYIYKIESYEAKPR